MWLEYYGERGEVSPPQDALQVLWPDAQDRLPDDPDFDPECRRLQTRLDRPPSSRRARPSEAA